MQAKNANIHGTDEAFLAFTMVQQIMTQLSGTAATGNEKSPIITKAKFRLLKNNVNNSSQASNNHSIQY
jgi:hypothetical protein